MLLAAGSANGAYKASVFRLRGSDLALRFVERPHNVTEFSVPVLEDIKRAARAESFKSA